MRHFFASTENRVFAALSLLATLALLFFVAPQNAALRFLKLPLANNDPFYISFLVLAILSFGAIFFFREYRQWRKNLTTLLFIWLPGMLILSYGINGSNNFHYIFPITLGAYCILGGILIAIRYVKHQQSKQSPEADSLSRGQWFRAQGLPSLLFVLFATTIFFSAGIYRLGNFAAVDEPLWLESRIGKYWHNIEQRDWKGTRVSDKPGITVSIASGPGLWFYNPKEFKTLRFEGEILNINGIKQFYIAFRLPLLIIITLFLPLFYFLLERLVGRRNALLSYALLATSPVLVGIAKIINPDSLLWVFTPLALLSYLVFLKRGFYRYLILSGILFGLALLTKYVANILFVFLFGVFFLEYLYHPKMTALSIATFIKKYLGDLALFVFVTLTTFYVIFPAVWVKPSKLITSTLYSQAFEKVAPLFLIIIAAILFDQWLNRSRLTTLLIVFLSRIKSLLAILLGAVFLSSMLFVIFNTWGNMHFYDFMDLLSSPKTIKTKSDFLGIFFTNFYPLLFGVTPMVFLGLLLSPFFLLKRKFYESESLRLAFYLIVFILLYYVGGTVNNVASIVRYQIIIFPLAAIIAGVALEHALTTLHKKFSVQNIPTPVLAASGLLFLGTISLLFTPFPLSYASTLLPAKYHIDMKDMGPGSYEMAQKLNTLPNAKDLLIWTDKDGVCKFFIGRCKRGRNYTTLRRDGLDYIVVSSTRESRTGKMMSSEITHNVPGLIRFDQYYQKKNPLFEIDINGRPNHFVKVFKFEE